MDKKKDKKRMPKRFVWSVTGEGERAFWTKVGSTFENRDGSETVLISNGGQELRYILREPKDQQKAAQAA